MRVLTTDHQGAWREAAACCRFRGGGLMQYIDRTNEPLRLAAELSRVSTLTSLLEFTLAELFHVFDANVVVFGVSGVRQAAAAVYPRTAALIHALENEASPIWEDGPLTRWCRSHPSWSPVRISDILTTQEWLQVPFYAKTARRIGATFLLYLPVIHSHTPELGGYFIGRTSRDFSAEEVRVASQLQPVLIVAHARYLQDLTQKNPLTPRQHEVLDLTASGLTAHAIGSRLGISSHTVRKHLKYAYQRLGTHDRASAVSELRARGLSGARASPWQHANIK